MTNLRLAWRFARRELRGGLTGFRVFLACLAMGVAAIAGVGSLSNSIEAGMRADAKRLLGGDVDLRLTHREATEDQRAWLEDNSNGVSMVVQMRAMAVRPDGELRRLVEFKAVDGAYPLYGGLVLEGGTDLDAALTRTDGIWGAAAERGLYERLELSVGDTVRIGDATLRLNAVIEKEPDRGTQAFNLGPRLMIPLAALEETGLVQPGSLIRYHYRVALAPEQNVTEWRARLNEAFPDAGWRIRDLENAAPNIQRFIDRVTVFMTLVGLTALLVGGVGVGNAVRAFLASKTRTIATWKCLGAPGRLIFEAYLIQVLAIALVGIAAGLVLGAVVPYVATPFIADRLPVEARVGVFAEPLFLAAGFGVLVTLMFSVLPLARAQLVPAASLFRDTVAPAVQRPSVRVLLAVLALGAGLAGLAVLSANDKWLAVYFVAGGLGTLFAFRLAAALVMWGASRLPRPRGARLRLAVANLHRPGAPTGGVVVSLGLGLTVLVAVALIEGNLNRQVGQTLRGEAPGFYFIDIQPDQIGTFTDIVNGFPVPVRTESVPMLRGHVTELAGTPVEQITPPPEVAWILRGDRGLTWSRTPPDSGSTVIAGDWWPADYNGAPLLSFDAEAAAALGLKIGDTIGVNVLGREVIATIANLRQIDWTTLGINFVMVFSPGLLEQAPQSYISTAHLPPDQELALERAITDALPNVTAIRVKEILESVQEILSNLGIAVRAIATVAIVAGMLVLAGAIAAGHKRRVYDSVVLKVLGATRRDVSTSFLLEYGIMGAVTAGIAALVGTGAAWYVITGIMDAEWTFLPSVVATTLLIAMVITIGFGMLGSWVALGRKAAPLLRNE